MADTLNSVFHASMDSNFYPVLLIAALAFIYFKFRSVSIPWDNQLRLLFTPPTRASFRDHGQPPDSRKGSTEGSHRKKIPAMLTEVGKQSGAV